MKRRATHTFIFVWIFFGAWAQGSLQKKAFYAVLQSTSNASIDKQLQQLQGNAGYSAFEGALLMKKAGNVNDPAKKIELFKSGRLKLEDCIKKDSTEVEYRFLRLIIQENSPKILQYNQEIKKDASYLRKNYKTLTSEVQAELFLYCQQSKELKAEDFSIRKHD